MKKELEKYGLLTDEISDENVNFHDLEEDDEDVLETVEDPKVQENLSTVNSDDSVKIYLQQIGKIPLLSHEQELDLAKKIYDVLRTQSGYDDMSRRFTVKQFNEYYGVTDFRVTTDNMCYCKFVDNSTKEKYYVFFGLSKENAQWGSVFILNKNNKQTKKTNKADINNQNLIQLINKNDL